MSRPVPAGRPSAVARTKRGVHVESQKARVRREREKATARSKPRRTRKPTKRALSETRRKQTTQRARPERRKPRQHSIERTVPFCILRAPLPKGWVPSRSGRLIVLAGSRPAFGGRAARTQGGGVRVLGGLASYLSITTQPSTTATTDVAFPTQPAIQLRDGNGNIVASSGVTVTASLASGTGAIGGTLTANTNGSGVATFTNLEIVGDGAHTLNFAASGYTAVVSGTVTVAASEEPADPGLGYLWEDDFDRYGSAIEMQWSVSECGATYPDAQSTYGKRTQANSASSCSISADYSLVTGRGGTGKALNSYVDGVTVGGRTWLTPWTQGQLGAAQGASHVIQYYFRLTGERINTQGCKWMELQHSAYNGNGRIQHAIDSRNGWHCVLGTNPGGTINRTVVEVVGYRPNDLFDAEWHRATHLFIPNTTSTYSNTGGTTSANETYSGTSSRDGRMAMFVDGVKVLDYSQAAFEASEIGGTRWCYQGDVDFIQGAGWTAAYLQAFPEYCNIYETNPEWNMAVDDLKWWEL